ncbi:uncharacterized protein JN550_003685 [Neoarthrinium moseri]|uniref:uncharacterized protein n=1 Tax=Neoarthrinium moseri TaxID=1658444 RepID=UPI001FDDA184|nr:uncharacterized protein JN550_003685 [Neoarthrinium moseri]KAI1872811.1 hypothetical protein JN550_003685 [Neoarthrinium moseri]
MAHGFDRLERFFGSTRRKDKTLQEQLAARRKVSVVYSPFPAGQAPTSNGSSLFPSPPFMKPTSARMQPRDPTYEKLFEEEGGPVLTLGKKRSQSLPNVQNQLRKCSSSYMTSETERKTRSYETHRPSSFALSQQPESPQRPAAFRFPEDSLFRPADSISPTKHVPQMNIPSMGTTSVAAKQSHELLDWTPAHISLMFNPAELSSVNENLGLNAKDDLAESLILMPSPLFTSPEKTPLKSSPTRLPRTPSPQCETVSEAHEWRFSLFPKQYSVLQNTAPQVYSPPSSDSEEEYRARIRDPSRSPGRVDSPSIYSVQSTPERVYRRKNRDPRQESTSPRETWGVRAGDPLLGSPESNDSPLPRSRLKKTASVASLSEVKYQIAQEQILQEPTINDIYALSDEDIAEGGPPHPPPRAPPPPPPKDVPRSIRHHQSARSVVRAHQALNLPAGEVTPPETPTDPQFLIPMPASHSIGELGAIMAAGIAKKYNFDLVYLVSVWPSGGGNHLDPSITSHIGSPPQSATLAKSLHASTGSSVTGRYLAAFGLAAEPPMRIHTRVLLKALQAAGWSEYEHPTESMSYGWTQSFHTDQLSFQRDDAGPRALKWNGNRGIVFAGYCKHPNEIATATELSRKQTLLDELHTDVKLLVDTLMERT